MSRVVLGLVVALEALSKVAAAQTTLPPPAMPTLHDVATPALAQPYPGLPTRLVPPPPSSLPSQNFGTVVTAAQLSVLAPDGSLMDKAARDAGITTTSAYNAEVQASNRVSLVDAEVPVLNDPLEDLPPSQDSAFSHSSALYPAVASAPQESGVPNGAWEAQILPNGLIYRSYLAGVKEPRIAGVWNYNRDVGWIWDIALGGRVGLFRYGTTDTIRPDGWQVDVEGVAFPRLALEEERDLTAVDFRAGFPITYGNGKWQTKFEPYHLSSHLGDEHMIKYGSAGRINYSRDVLVLGQSYYPTEAWRLYAEFGYAVLCDVSEPWEFQFGTEFSTLQPTGAGGSPFLAFNVHLREEVDFGGNVVLQAGWQWRGDSGHLFRFGFQYYTGKDDQFEFYDQHVDKYGIGLWYDF